MNFKIFPATLNSENQKVPLIKGWRENASNDQNQIRAWQELFRERISFWGIPCGAINGIFALDVDVKTNGWKTIQDHGFEIPDTLTQKTLNGGQHFIFKFDPQRDTGNKVGFLPGLDIRSSGGWIAFYGVTDWSKQILDAPLWIYEYVNKSKANTPKQEANSSVRLSPEIAQQQFYDSIQAIINAPAGESNDILNIESFKVGQLVASQAVTREFAEQELFRAAKMRGKPDYEAKATIQSGLNGGASHALTVPFSSVTSAPQIDIPAPPAVIERWTPRLFTRADLLNTSKLKKPAIFEYWSTEDIHLTTADGGTGKTTLKLNEAVCLALGIPFLGFLNKQRGKTLFITGEDTAEKLGAILGAICNQMGLLKPSPENDAKIETILNSVIIKKDADLCLIQKDRQNFLFPSDLAMQKITQAVEDLQPKMIVFDPISSFWGSETMLNDMNKAVTRFMSTLVDKANACVEMVNHSGKASSASKDVSQFSGRGGSGLPSNSRVVRTLVSVTAEEFTELTGTELKGDQTAMKCVIGKFTDGSPLFNKPFLIIRSGYLFNRLDLSPAQVRQFEKELGDKERVFNYIKQCRNDGKYPTKNVIIGHLMSSGDPMSKDRIVRALDMTQFEGVTGEKVLKIDNPDPLKKDEVFIITDMEGKES